jgi:hypothetical protein
VHLIVNDTGTPRAGSGGENGNPRARRGLDHGSGCVPLVL